MMLMGRVCMAVSRCLRNQHTTICHLHHHYSRPVLPSCSIHTTTSFSASESEECNALKSEGVQRQECVEALLALEAAVSQLQHTYRQYLHINTSQGDIFHQQYPRDRAKVEALIRDYDVDFALQRIREHGARGQNAAILADQVIQKLLKDNLIDELLSLVKLLVNEHIPINSPTYTRLLKDFIQHMKRNKTTKRDQKKFLDLVTFMHGNGYEADNYQQYQILKFASVIGNTNLAQACLQKLQSNNTFKDAHYNLLLLAYSNRFRSGTDVDINKSGEVFRHFKDGILQGIKFERKTIHTLIHYAVDLIGCDDSEHLVCDVIGALPEEDQQPHLTYLDNAFVERCLKTGDVDGAWSVAQKSKFSSCRSFIRFKLPEYT